MPGEATREREPQRRIHWEKAVFASVSHPLQRTARGGTNVGNQRQTAVPDEGLLFPGPDHSQHPVLKALLTASKTTARGDRAGCWKGAVLGAQSPLESVCARLIKGAVSVQTPETDTYALVSRGSWWLAWVGCLIMLLPVI